MNSGTLMVVLGSVFGALALGMAIGMSLSKPAPLSSVETWGCEAIHYVGPTGDNHAVYASEYDGWRTPSNDWPDLNGPGYRVD